MNNILCKYLFKHQSLLKASKAHTSYVCLKNNIDLDIDARIKIATDNSYNYIIGVNSLMVFNTISIRDYIVSTFKHHPNIHIVLPTSISLPMELTPFCMKICKWSINFINQYIASGYDNVKTFLTSVNGLNNKHILLSNAWCNRSKKSSIINSLTEYSYKQIQKIIENSNKQLGIIA